MATNTYFFAGNVYPDHYNPPIPGFDYNPSLGQLLIFQGHTVVPGATAGQQILQLTNGLQLKLVGTGFQYDAQGHGIAGTLTSLELLLSDGTTQVQTLTGLNLDFQDFYSAADAYGPAALAQWLMRGDDVINGSGQNDDLVGGAGNDTLSGLGGSDSFDGGAGTDTYSGGTSGTDIDTLSFESAYSDSNAFRGVSINAGTQVVIDPYGNTESVNTMEAFRGTQFNDVMVGAAANESFMGLGGGDNIDGGLGIDEVRYDRDSVKGGTTGITVNLTTGLAIDGFGKQDTLANIENVRGTLFGDVIIGDTLNNALIGFGGNDTLQGGAGADRLDGGAGTDTTSYSSALSAVRVYLSTPSSNAGDALGDTFISIENISGSSFNDVLTGNSGVNFLNGSTGQDNMRGLAGSDTYFVDNAIDIVNESLAGSSGVDRIISSISFSLSNTTRVFGSVENLTLSGTGAISGTGNALGNAILGNAAANVLNGAAGNDTINGGLGNDTLVGSVGNDRFVFNTAPNAATNVDRITDFNVVNDTIALENSIFTALGATTGTLTSAMFWKSTSGVAHDPSDRIIYETDTGKLFYDSNGSGAGGSVHFATLTAGLALTNADFLII